MVDFYKYELYKQISDWDCGPTCLAWLARFDPDTVRELAKRAYETWRDGLDGYELEGLMDQIAIVYQPIIPSEINKNFTSSKTMLCMIGGVDTVHKSGNHWIIIQNGLWRDPLKGMQYTTPKEYQKIYRAYLIE